MATIKDVARQAGVSPSTVSRVISNHSSISESTKKHVRQVMRKLNYYPNMNARNLVHNRAYSIGIVLPTDSDNFYQNPYFPAVLRGINQSASQSNYSIVLTTGQSEQERLAHIEKMIYGKQVDGLIFLYSSRDQIMDFVESIKFPAVVMGRPDTNQMSYVENDNQAIAFEATQFLIKRGHTHLAFIGGDLTMSFMQDRFNGFLKACQQESIGENQIYRFNEREYTLVDGQAIGEYLCIETPCRAVLVADQLVGRGVDRGFLKKEVPFELITFKAFSTHETHSKNQPAYIALPNQESGQRAVAILFDLIELESNTSSAQRIVREVLDAHLIMTS